MRSRAHSTQLSKTRCRHADKEKGALPTECALNLDLGETLETALRGHFLFVSTTEGWQAGGSRYAEVQKSDDSKNDGAFDNAARIFPK